jgi:hypothetical protein
MRRDGRAVACGAALLVLVCARQASPQFTSFRSDPHTILDGHWQSCQEKDGTYSERVYDHVINGVGQFEVHLGPRNEFAIFPGVQDEHRAHSSSQNLLKPFKVPFENDRAKHRWDVPSLGLTFTVTLAGGSFSDCDSWYITLAPASRSSD